MAGAAVTFLSVTLAYVILHLRVYIASEIIGLLSVSDTHIPTKYFRDSMQNLLPRARANI